MRFHSTWRLFLFFTIVFNFTFTDLQSQGITCETALEISLNNQPVFINEFIDQASSGMTGFVGCNNFANLPVQWIKMPYYDVPSVLSITNYSEKEIQVGLYRGGCHRREFFKCAVLASPSMYYNPEMTANFQITQADLYYLQIAYTDGSAQDYQIELLKQATTSTCYDSQSQLNPVNTSLGSPTEGPYAPGETVTFCAQINWNSYNSCQYLHGVVPILGKGWEDYDYTVGPNNFNAYNGYFSWFDQGLVQYNFDGTFHSLGEFLPGGWFVTGVPGNNSGQCANGQHQFDPNCSYGVQQPCNQNYVYDICFDLTVKQNIDCAISSEADLSIKLEIFSDGETGGFTTPGCGDDGPIISNHGAQCCDQINQSPLVSPNTVCNNQPIEIDLNNLLNNVPNPSDYSFVYRVQSIPVLEGFENCFENCGSLISAVPMLLSPNLPSTVLISVSILDSENCFVGNHKIEIVVENNTDIEVEINSSIGTNQVCQDPNGFLITLSTDILSSCGNFFSYEWIGPNGFFATGPFVQASEPGTYSVTLTDDLGNIGVADYEISYYPQTSLSYTGPTQLCPSNSLQDVLSATPPGGTWTGDGVEIDRFFGPTPGNYSISYSYEDSNGCTTTSDFNIEVTLDPEVTVDAPNFVCISDTPQDVLVPSPVGGVYDPSPILMNGMVIANTPGTYSLTYRYGDPSSACSESFTFDISIIDIPIVDLLATTAEICLSTAPQDILINSPLGGNYLTGNVDANGFFIADNIGINIVEYEYIDPSTGCSNTATFEITVTDGDVLTINDPGALCPSDSPIQIEATPSGGTFSGNNITPDGLFTPNNIGIEIIGYSYTNSQGCESTLSAEIEVIVGTNITVVHPNNVCVDQDPIQIDAFPVGGTFTGNISQDGIFEPSNIGVNNFVYSYENTLGCITDYNFSIEVLDYVIPQIASLPNPVCFSQSDVYQLIAEPAGGTFNGNVSASGEFIPNQLGFNTITYGPGPDNECILNSNIVIEVIPELNVLVNHPTSLCRNSIPYDVLEPNIPGGTWEGPVTPDGRFQAFDFGFNEVTYTIDDPISGCSGTYTFEIEVIETSDLNVPQFFPPADDSYCIFEIVELCIDPVVDAVSYRWETNFGIIEYASPNRLCTRIGWNALLQDEICVYPIGDCGISLNPLCHTVDIIDDISCIVINTGTDDIVEEKINIYPNPAKDNIYIDANIPIQIVSIYSAIGQLIETFKINNLKSLNYPLDKFDAGIYFIQVNNKQLEKLVVLDN